MLVPSAQHAVTGFSRRRQLLVWLFISAKLDSRARLVELQLGQAVEALLEEAQRGI